MIEQSLPLPENQSQSLAVEQNKDSSPLTPQEQNELATVMQSAMEWLKSQQHQEGYWVGMLESNSCMEAEWVLAQHVLGVTDDPKYAKVIQCILNEQRADGSWEVYYQAPSGDINATVECYAALRVAGLDPQGEALQKARQWILAHGGLKNIRVFTKYWLALLGEWPWQFTPQLPPEIIFLPRWAPFCLYKFSSWARGTIIPLTILSARRRVHPLPPEKRMDELFPEGRANMDYSAPRKQGVFSWENFFSLIDRCLSTYVNSPWHPGRELAIKLCKEWIVQHQEADGAWSGIQPPWIYSLMALHTEGYSLNHPVLKNGLEAFNKHWSYEKNGGIYLQASESPVWDTLLSTLALLDCDQKLTETPEIEQALDWILQKQITAPGDWKVYSPNAPAGGWAFERANDFYPDLDDTAVAMMVLARLRNQVADPTAINQALARAEGWVLAMQSNNGGWGAFDKDNNSSLVTKIPFCDFGEALDPPSVDVTSHIIEALALLDYSKDHPAVAKALAYIKQEQEPEGPWFGRWGVNYIYGTAAVLPALKEIGEDMNQPYIRKAADWIIAHQNADGGWGECCQSYMDDSLRGKGESTASQTAWAMMALLATQSHDYDDSLQKGMHWLLQHHQDGTWDEPQYTGTGFPGYGVGERVYLNQVGDKLEQGLELSRAFMINYNYYRHYFPMMALGRAWQHFQEKSN